MRGGGWQALLVLSLVAAGCFSGAPGLAHAQSLLWPELARLVAPLEGGQGQAARHLAERMQGFVQSPPGNQSLALQAMGDVQRAMLCLYAVQGPQAADTARALSQAIMRDEGRARAFAANQALILGEELAFDPNPQTWKSYCPFRVEP